MKKYVFQPETELLMRGSSIPFAIYQFIDKRVCTILLSNGFCELFDLPDYEEACALMDNDMYRDTHPEDISRIADAAFRFAEQDEPYDVIYRSHSPRQTEDHVIHAIGRHFHTQNGERLAVVWYTDESTYLPPDEGYSDGIEHFMSDALRKEKMLRNSYYDMLTGLPNMWYFFELAEAGRKSMFERGEQPVLLFIDLSGMKGYNRKYGYKGGNQLIISVAKLLVKYFTAENCGRFGADHFVVYTNHFHLEKRLKQLFKENEQLNGGKSLPLRVGIYLDHFDQIDISTACDRAKMACDVNRKTYISVYEFFDETLLNISVNRSFILENLDTALRENWIKVFYQPIIRMTNGKVCDEEALARWVDPVRGFLSPAEFIPILEDARLIYKLDLYMVDQILEHMKQKEEKGITAVPVSVNLSRSDFDVCDIVEEIRKRVDRAGIRRNMLNIEITESVIGKDYDYMKVQVERFQELGFRVWMDDFGTGYSALDVLQKFDFDLIKFDMTFIQQYYTSKKSQIILTELMQMVVKLGIDTVAEGVETEDHIRFLRGIGCDKIQGFFYSKPVPLDVIMEWYRKELAIELENLQESDYYTTVGTINLNDPTLLDHSDEEEEHLYLNRIPMGIVELKDGKVTIIRSNHAYDSFLNRCFQIELPIQNIREVQLPNVNEAAFIQTMKTAVESGDWVKYEETLPNRMKVQSLLRRITVNPVTGAEALLVVVTSVSL